MKKQPEWKPTATDTRCGVLNEFERPCGGALWNDSSRMHEVMGTIKLRCDRCTRMWVVKVLSQEQKA